MFWNFEHIENSAHTAEVLGSRKVYIINTLTPFSPNVKNKNINSNHGTIIYE